MQHGEPVAEFGPPRKKPPIDVAKSRALTDSMTVCGEGVGDFVRRMRDEDRY